MASHKDTIMARWTEQLTQLFVSLMVDEVKKGNRTTCTYNKVGWNNIRREFNKQTGHQFTLVQFKNKAFKLKKLYGSFKKLLSQTGFGWDNVINRVVVDDESVWESHIMDNSEWAKFRKEGFPLYPQLCIVFGDTYTYATKEYALGNVKELVSLEDDDNGAWGENDGGVAVGTPKELRAQEPQVEDRLGSEHQTKERFNNELAATPVRENHELDRTRNSKRVRKSASYEFASTCKAIQEALKIKMGQSSQTSVTSMAPQTADPFSIGAMIAILKGMPDMDPRLYAKAVNHACVNAAWREAFILTEPEWRRALLDSIDSVRRELSLTYNNIH